MGTVPAAPQAPAASPGGERAAPATSRPRTPVCRGPPWGAHGGTVPWEPGLGDAVRAVAVVRVYSPCVCVCVRSVS